MKNEDLNEKDEMSRQTAEEAKHDKDDLSDKRSLNNNDKKHDLQLDKVEASEKQKSENPEHRTEEVESSKVNKENHNLHHHKEVEGSDNQTVETGQKPEESQSLKSSEGNHSLQSANVEGLAFETVERKPEEIQFLNNNEENHNLHHEKAEDSGDPTTQTVKVKPDELQPLDVSEEKHKSPHGKADDLNDQTINTSENKSENPGEKNQSMDLNGEEKLEEPVFDGTEIPEVEVSGSSSAHSLDLEAENQAIGWPVKALSLKNYVKEKSTVAVSSVLRRLSGRKDDDEVIVPDSQEKNANSMNSPKDEQNSQPGNKPEEVSTKPADRSMWNPLYYMMSSKDVDYNTDQVELVCTQNSLHPLILKGRILLYSRLGCQNCREVRSFLHQRKLRYVEINIDVYPSRKLELEKFTGSQVVPMVFFNELPVGGLSELKDMDESGELKDKTDSLMYKEPSSNAPLPPLSGEDDESCSGTVDELAIVVRKMKNSISVKDRFYRMRRYCNCFLGSDAVDFLMQDQDLQREQAVEFARKLATKYFIRHVLEENVFEDGSYFYRFLDHDRVVMSQCYNMPKGIIDVKPKSLTDISCRLRFLAMAIYQAYTSEDGRHVDYRSIHGSEEFARYLRVVEELQRVEMHDISREEKLAFFINLYNMMAIHAILIWGFPTGALERRKMFGDFKYVIGGLTYSLSAIENGILRGNQRPPYNLIKPFGAKDLRAKIALPYPEPLIHFALVNGTRSGPALRCFSPGNIDKELMEVASNFLRNGGVVFNLEAKVASVSKILRWFSGDFGKTEVEVLKHAANYLETGMTEEVLELLANTQLKVVYQNYDWGLNC